MTSMSAPAPRKLPVWSTVGACYALVARNLGQLVRISWLWLLIMLPVYAATNWVIWPWATESAWKESSWIAELVSALSSLIELPFLASIAVAWHRLILNRETTQGVVYLRLDPIVWRYAALLFALLVPSTGAMMYVSSQTPLIEKGLYPWPVVIGVMAGVVAWFLLLPRFSLVLPAIALDRSLTVREAWGASGGNTLRLALATVLCSLPPLVPIVLVFSYIDTGTRASWTLSAAMISLTWAVAALVAVTLLSVAFQFFVRHQDPGTLTTA